MSEQKPVVTPKNPRGFEILFRVEPQDLIEASKSPEEAKRIMQKYGISKQLLASEIEKLAKVISIQSGDMMMV